MSCWCMFVLLYWNICPSKNSNKDVKNKQNFFLIKLLRREHVINSAIVSLNGFRFFSHYSSAGMIVVRRWDGFGACVETKIMMTNHFKFSNSKYRCVDIFASPKNQWKWPKVRIDFCLSKLSTGRKSGNIFEAIWLFFMFFPSLSCYWSQHHNNTRENDRSTIVLKRQIDYIFQVICLVVGKRQQLLLAQISMWFQYRLSAYQRGNSDASTHFHRMWNTVVIGIETFPRLHKSRPFFCGFSFFSLIFMDECRAFVAHKKRDILRKIITNELSYQITNKIHAKMLVRSWKWENNNKEMKEDQQIKIVNTRRMTSIVSDFELFVCWVLVIRKAVIKKVNCLVWHKS